MPTIFKILYYMLHAKFNCQLMLLHFNKSIKVFKFKSTLSIKISCIFEINKKFLLILIANSRGARGSEGRHNHAILKFSNSIV